MARKVFQTTYPNGMNRSQYEYSQHRQASRLDPANAPASATHIAKCLAGHEYYVAFKDGSWWIQPSEHYGKGYAFNSLYVNGPGGAFLRELPVKA